MKVNSSFIINYHGVVSNFIIFTFSDYFSCRTSSKDVNLEKPDNWHLLNGICQCLIAIYGFKFIWQLYIHWYVNVLHAVMGFITSFVHAYAQRTQGTDRGTWTRCWAWTNRRTPRAVWQRTTVKTAERNQQAARWNESIQDWTGESQDQGTFIAYVHSHNDCTCIYVNACMCICVTLL